MGRCCQQISVVIMLPDGFSGTDALWTTGAIPVTGPTRRAGGGHQGGRFRIKGLHSLCGEKNKERLEAVDHRLKKAATSRS
jgi:hypothetical protein